MRPQKSKTADIRELSRTPVACTVTTPYIRGIPGSLRANGDKTNVYAMRRISLAILAIFASTLHASAQDVGDAKQGSLLALATCAQCHAIRPGESRSPNPMAPNFTSIATTLGMTDRALRVWLQSSHPTMPNIILSNDEKDNVVAYIMSLRTAN